jgi:RHS repeat-associated protein
MSLDQSAGQLDRQIGPLSLTRTGPNAGGRSGITYSDGITPNVSNVTYDNDGQRTGMTDVTGSSTWVWDSLHRLTSYTNGDGKQIQWGYNLRNLPTTITYPGSLAVTRGYDDAGRLTSVRDWNNNTTTFGYDPNSNLTTETFPSGTGVVDTFTFDNADQLMATSVTKGATTLFSATYSRDNANQLSSDSSEPPRIGSYKYNPLNQLCYAGSSNGSACSAPPSDAIAYAYDAADNLTQNGATQQVFNIAAQLCWTAPTSGPCSTPPVGATTYTYDNRGNRTNVTPPTGPAITLGYDQANRLISYAAATTATYKYNGDGLRMSKTTPAGTSQFVWDMSGTLPLLLKDGATAYVYGPGGLPLEQINGSTTYYFHHDQLGSTRLLTDATGATPASYTYDPYGNLIATTGSITSPLQFAGEYTDSESGLLYLRARYYDPATGSFLTRDLAVTTTRAPYAYVKDNPLNATDPRGLCDWAMQIFPATSGLCAFEHVTPYVANTPLAAPTARAAQAGYDAVDPVMQHATYGAGVCAGVCGGFSQQGDTTSGYMGGFGILGRGPSVGWAGQTASRRHPTAYTVAVGQNDDKYHSPDWCDWEVDIITGVGGEVGGTGTVFSHRGNDPRKGWGSP